LNLAEAVVSNSKSVTGGYSYSNYSTLPINIHRYSGEYDVIVKPVSAFYQNFQINNIEIDGANCALNIRMPDVFILPEFYHVKYSQAQLLELENSTKYLPVYPLIDEEVKLVDEMYRDGLITNKDYWVQVMKGLAPINLEYVKVICKRAVDKIK
jgi:hypothetical protein